MCSRTEPAIDKESVVEFLSDFTSFFVKMLTDWPIGTVIGVLIIMCVLLITGLIGCGLFVAIDSWFLPRKQGTGRVVAKAFTPAHTQWIYLYNAATKTSLPQPVFHSDDWSLEVDINGKRDNMSVSEAFYKSLDANATVLVTYVEGRLSDQPYLKEIAHA